jgi:hypothetical protein
MTVTKLCELCGKEFKTPNCQANRRKFCSRSCSQKIVNSLRKGSPLSENRKNQLNRLHIHTKLNPPMKGISRCGEKSPTWKGGITPLYRGIRQLEKYSNWRKQVLVKDNYKCQLCNELGLNAHHIKSFKNIILENNIKTTGQALKCEELWFVSNGICLCNQCHYKIHTKEKNDRIL